MSETESLPERRDFFRVDDRLALRVRPIDTPTFALQTPADLLPTYTLLEELHSIDVEQSVILRSINDKSRDLGQYLKAQQRKLELLARHLVLQQTRDLFELTNVNLSGNGIGFVSAVAYAQQQWLELDLVIFPDAWCASLRAQVISCSPHQDQFQIGAEFVDLREEQRDAIVRHCLLVDGHKRKMERET